MMIIVSPVNLHCLKLIHFIGNIISDGRVVMKSEGVQNVHFGITNDGSLHFG